MQREETSEVKMNIQSQLNDYNYISAEDIELASIHRLEVHLNIGKATLRNYLKRHPESSRIQGILRFKPDCRVTDNGLMVPSKYDRSNIIKDNDIGKYEINGIKYRTIRDIANAHNISENALRCRIYNKGINLDKAVSMCIEDKSNKVKPNKVKPSETKDELETILSSNNITITEFHRCLIHNRDLSFNEILDRLIKNRQIPENIIAKIKLERIKISTYLRYKDLNNLSPADTIELILNERYEFENRKTLMVGKQYKTVNGHNIKIVEYTNKINMIVEFDDGYRVSTKIQLVDKGYIFHNLWDTDEMKIKHICEKCGLQFLHNYINWLKAGKPDINEYMQKQVGGYINIFGELIVEAQ